MLYLPSTFIVYLRITRLESEKEDWESFLKKLYNQPPSTYNFEILYFFFLFQGMNTT